MPRYDFACRNCGDEREFRLTLDEFSDPKLLYCLTCEEQTEHELILRAAAVEDWGMGRWFEHLGPEGMTFYDKASYKRHLKEHGIAEWAPRRGMPGQEV